MGPESTAIFYQALIQQCQRLYGAYLDKDYPEIFIYNLPIPDVVEQLETPQQTAKVLTDASKKLIKFGADFLAMPCNTVHYFYPEIIKYIDRPFICIFLATAKKIRLSGLKRVGFLSTETTLKLKSYGDDFSRNGIELIVPSPLEQADVNQIIVNILAGKKNTNDKNRLIEISNSLKVRGAEGVVLACTDLPILLKQEDIRLKLFDTVDILAEATIQYCLGKIGDEILYPE